MFMPVNDELTLRSRLAQIIRSMDHQKCTYGQISLELENQYYTVMNELIALDPDQYAID